MLCKIGAFLCKAHSQRILKIFWNWWNEDATKVALLQRYTVMKTGFPVMKTGISLWEKLHRENPVFITGMGLQWSYRFSYLQKLQSIHLPLIIYSVTSRQRGNWKSLHETHHIVWLITTLLIIFHSHFSHTLRMSKQNDKTNNGPCAATL